MLALHGEMQGGTRFNISYSDYGAISVNTKITILQLVGLAQGKKRRVLLYPLIATFSSGENNTTSRGG